MTLGLGRIAAAGVMLVFSSPGQAAPATESAPVVAQVVKPVTLRWEQDLNLGSILLAPGTWSAATVSIAQNGAFVCDPRLTCSGVRLPARYRITGNNRQVIRINAPNVTLRNNADPTQTLLLTVSSPGAVTLTSSGAPGNPFNLGGSISVSSTTADGLYVGTFNVTVDY